MTPIYNSNIGRTKRPRKEVKGVGQMSRDLRSEVSKMTKTELQNFKLQSRIYLLNLGINIQIL